VFLLDPLIATGGTARAALAMIADWGIPGEPSNETMVVSKSLHPNTVKDIKLLCILASQDGLKNVQAEYPDLEVISCRCVDANVNEPISQIWVAGMDEILTPEGIISPGLGDTVEFS
jgi:uracil phosphoribosyltransferase